MSAEPATKKAKTGEAAEATDVEVKAPEKYVEVEEDAVADKGPKVKEASGFHTQDTTMNCMPSTFGNLFSPLTDGGLQYLLAGARSSIGVKSGRYMFEAQICENMCPAQDPAAKSKTPQPHSQLRIGLSTGGSTLFLGENEDSISFDTEGVFTSSKMKTTPSEKFGNGDVVAIVLNLDTASTNANTVSLFKNGERICKPQLLPESLKGKALFPTFTFKNVTFHYNFGPLPMVALPFKCRMINDASAKDVTAAAAADKPKDGKHEVLFPVCLPDEGSFDWLDTFMEANKDYTELSDRAILAWAEKSGMTRTVKTRTSNDNPEMGFGIAMMDDGSIRRVLAAVAPIQPRNYVVMEVKSSLMKEERKDLCKKWASSGFKRTAQVMMGQPPAALAKKWQETALQQKQELSDIAFRKKKAEEQAEKEVEKKKKKLEKDKARAVKAVRKRAELAKKKLAEGLKKKEAELKGEIYIEPDEEIPEPPSEPEEEDEDVDMDESPPTVQLSAEEKKHFFRKAVIPDLTTYHLSSSFGKFTIPEKADGLEEVKFEWHNEDKCKDYLKCWIRDRKATSRIEDLQPSEWFTNKFRDWQKTLQQWHSKQNMHKQAVSKRASDKIAKVALKESKRRAKEAAARKKIEDARKKVEDADQKALEEAEKKLLAESKGERYEPPAEEPEPVEEEEAKEEEEQPEEEQEDEPAEVDYDAMDVFSLDDFLDIGNGGEPLFSKFQHEDWTIMSLRFELHLLAHAFKKDVKDADRPGMILEHLPFYYQKYYKKALNTKFYGFETVKEICDLLRDTVVLTGKNQIVEPLLPEEMESSGIFVMLTEECRRDRERRICMGEEAAKLKIAQPGVAGMSNVTAIRPGMPVSVGVRPAMTAPQSVRPAMGVRPGIAQVGYAPAGVRPGMGFRPGFQQPMW